MAKKEFSIEPETVTTKVYRDIFGETKESEREAKRSSVINFVDRLDDTLEECNESCVYNEGHLNIKEVVNYLRENRKHINAIIAWYDEEVGLVKNTKDK